MKTPEQIREWLQKQEWYESFRRQAEEYLSSELYKTLNGYDGTYTISYAFYWQHSKEGDKYWREINRQFQEWYNKEETI